MSLKQRVLATMKSEDTEGPFELYVTRTPGYVWALLFRALHVHPIAVTLISILIGAASGYFFYFDDLRMNLIGMGLLVWANWYDCADGQLARMTGQRTLVGRLLDGLAGDIWFFCIYLAIVLRLQPQLGIWIWLLCAYAGFICHGRPWPTTTRTSTCGLPSATAGANWTPTSGRTGAIGRSGGGAASGSRNSTSSSTVRTPGGRRTRRPGSRPSITRSVSGTPTATSPPNCVGTSARRACP